jgi:virulence factor Mce-like protein
MKRILLSVAVLLAVGAFLVIAGGASNSGNAAGTYKIDLDNAFGLVQGADFKVAGVPAGKIQSIDLPQGCVKGNTYDCHAQVTVSVTQSGFGQFRTDAFCQSRPQSLIGEYFIECQPGHSGTVLKPGSTIPVTHTQSTIPGDLLQSVMQMPYRERLTLIINELGAAVAGRSTDLQAALRRAVPALDETDNLLNLLANDSHTLQALTSNANSVITALANNKVGVQRFITEANNAATATATQQSNLQATFRLLPAFLAQLRPAMKKLGQAADANTPVLVNLNAASGELDRLFTDLPAFSRSAIPALKSLGQASITGRQAVIAAGPTIKALNAFAKPTPELAQNLAIVLRDLDDRSRAVEPDSRSPGGKGYTGLEALLQYVFNQTLAINGFGQHGHFLAVDAFVDVNCSPYASPQSVANGLAASGPSYRQCYSWLGPNQPGINETDPSDPSACVPDPGGAPAGEPGPKTTACRLRANPTTLLPVSDTPRNASARGSTASRSASTGSSSAGGSSPSAGGRTGRGGGGGGRGTLSHIGAALGGGSGSSGSSAAASSSSSSSGQTQQLLNYLLSP